MSMLDLDLSDSHAMLHLTRWFVYKLCCGLCHIATNADRPHSLQMELRATCKLAVECHHHCLPGCRFMFTLRHYMANI
jgi:hypothetical protein